MAAVNDIDKSLGHPCGQFRPEHIRSELAASCTSSLPGSAAARLSPTAVHGGPRAMDMRCVRITPRTCTEAQALCRPDGCSDVDMANKQDVGANPDCRPDQAPSCTPLQPP